jgi:hypothetical protein
MKAGCTPATQHDTGRAAAARSLERQGSSAAQQVMTVQPMSHLPSDRASASGATDWRPAGYCAGSAGRAGGRRRRRRLFKACRERPRSPAATP